MQDITPVKTNPETDLADPFQVDWSKLGPDISNLSRGLKFGLMVLLILFANLTGWFVPLLTRATPPADMLLFWDPANGSIPTGWCLLSTYNGYFPRGDTPANFGTTVNTATRPYIPTIASATVSAPSTTGITGNGGNAAAASETHTHPSPTITMGSDNNGDATSNPDLPAFRSLQLMEYGSGSGTCTGAGIPNTIPQHAIAMFSALPSGWTAVTAQNNEMIRVNSTVASGGGDNESNEVDVPSLGASSGTGNITTFLGSQAAAAPNHTHNAPTTLTCTSGCATPTTACSVISTSASLSKFTCTTVNDQPPYVQPILASANNATSTLSLNITAMFDGDPGGGWVVLSNSGGSYYQKFLRPSTTRGLPQQGNLTHTGVYSGVTGTANTGTANDLAFLDASAATETHTHTVTITTNPVSNVPPYFDVVIAQKVNFTFTHFQWYVDNNVENESDKWPSGSLNVAQDAQIPAIPAPYQPPTNGSQLRIRAQIQVTGEALAINTITFKLQYAEGTAASNCIGGSWNDVAASSATTDPWRYGTEPAPPPSTNLTDGQQLVTNKLTSTHLENFYESSSTGTGFTNPVAAATGDTIEYDWAIQDYQATGGSQYNFRVIENQGTPGSGVLLSVYSTCPSVVTLPTTDELMRHGEFFQDGSDQGFEWAN